MAHRFANDREHRPGSIVYILRFPYETLPAVKFCFYCGSFRAGRGHGAAHSVTYNTQKATLPLTDDQRQQADELLREAQQANQAGKYGDAMRSLYQGLAVMRNVPWTPGRGVRDVAAGQAGSRDRGTRSASQRDADAAVSPARAIRASS